MSDCQQHLRHLRGRFSEYLCLEAFRDERDAFAAVSDEEWTAFMTSRAPRIARRIWDMAAEEALRLSRRAS